MENLRTVFRDKSLSERIVFIDGLSGSGKSMISPLISSLESSEIWLINHIYEFTLIMHSLGHISLDAAETIIKTYVDLDCYNLMIGRNVNYRPTDDSSVQKNQLQNVYDERRLGDEGAIIEERVNKENPINIFMSHYIFSESKPLFSALDNRLKIFVVPVRHPYWLVEHWINQDWDNRMSDDIRDPSIQYKLKEKIYTWHGKINLIIYLNMSEQL